MNRLLSIFAICLFHLGLFAQDGGKAEFYTSGYYVQGGETHIAGETKLISGYMLDEGGEPIESTIATLTFGVEGGNDFMEAIWDYQVNNFNAYIPGNGENGSSQGGTMYTISPNTNGYVTVGVVLNANKPFYILEDGVALEGFNGLTVNEQYRGTYNFPVKAGSTYKLFAEDSKLGFYGFTLLYNTDPTFVYEVHNMTVKSNLKNNVYINYSGTSLQATGNTLWLYSYAYSSSYRFKHWTVNGGVVSTEQSFAYTMPNHDVEIVAVYEFNPYNPGDPASAENSYKLTLESKPDNAGYFNMPKVSKVAAGSTTWIYAYSNRQGFVFQEWQVDGNKISSQPELEFTMPEQNVTLTAVYKFSPTNPGNPGTNRFDAESGELVLDDFTPGNAYNAAWNATGGNLNKVTSIIFIGEVSNWDVPDIVNSCSNCSVLDASRTTGMNYVYSYAFSNNEKLTTISLPATIQYIYYYAFEGCTALNTLNIHAVTPPSLDVNAFGYGEQSIAGNVTVYVPASSLSLYQQSEEWQAFQAILPFTTEVCDLEVNFPAGTDMAVYKDMYLEAVNTASGQRLRYVITNQTVYTFSNIIKNTTWNISLKNANGDVLGEIPNVEVKDNNVSVTFEALKVLKSVSLAVVEPDETDVTSLVTIMWADKNGNFLAQGATVKNLLDGNVVKYNITLPESLAKQYQLPAAGEYAVTAESDGNITVQLVPLQELTIAGSVTDHNNDNAALQDAVIAVSQTINGQYSKTFVTKTDAEGMWSLKVFDAPTEITASKTGYIAQTLKPETLTATIPTFELRDINGTTINLSLRYKPIEGEETDYEDIANVAYTIVDEATGEKLTEMSVQFPKIVLMEKYAEGTQFAITATSKNQKFLPLTVAAVVNDKDAASATFVIKQLGGIKASYNETDNNACVGILYDANGQLVKRYEYANKQLVISELPDGSYTLVTMGNSMFFNSVGLLSQFAESGLRNGVDYVRQNVNVVSGAYQVLTFTRVPFFDETKLYYTGANTSFSASKSQVTAGQYLTLRGQVDFKDAYAGQVSNVNLIVDMTPDCEFVANSVMLGKNLTGYTLNGNQLVVPIGNSTEQVRFCVIPTKEGTYEPTASVSFTINGKNVLQPIGSAQTNVKGVTITVPVTTANPQFTASGTATAKSDVYVYADEILVGKTVAKANGKWTALCDLGNDAVDNSEYPVYARITTPQNAELITDTKTVTLDKDAILPQQVSMSFFNGWLHQTQKVEWDMIEKKANPTSYMFYTTTDFTFIISFTVNNPEVISNVQLVVYKTDNTYDILDASYNDKNNKIWVASHRYSSYALPTTVKVKYVINDVQMTQSEDADDEGNEHSNPILDPSGFVYEAVSSNRLQGVTASIYYKEEIENEYGDKEENIVLWNAEDYAQQNPQFTDENGMYQWDVPNGLWQVRLEKEGYLKTNSEWLPVPPPQLDINLPMVQMKQPSIINPKAFASGVEFEFDKYMTPATLTAENITVNRNGTPLAGVIKLQNEEAAYEGATESYASKVLFEVAGDVELTSNDEIQLIVNKAVESYAGVQMRENYSQKFVVEPIVRSIRIDSDLDLVNIGYGETRTLTIAALPTEAAKGKTINVQSLSELVATVNVEQLLLDENGQAELVITGELPGSTVLGFAMADSDVEGQLTVNVKEAKNMKTIEPRASRVSGSQLYRGAKILLTSETEDAVIKYTLDGSNPAEAGESVLTYSAPIIINDDNITIKAIAIGKDLEPSEVTTFNYGLKKSTINYQMATGWTWISHNMESAIATADVASNVVRIVSQTSEAVNDPQYGLVGALTELQPAVGYKVQVSATTEKSMQGFEMNANENTVSVVAGWNWIGYPLNLEMTVDEALEYFDATAGDMIVGQEANATYDGTKWQGTLQSMKPGEGYLFKTASSTEIQFNTNITSDAVNYAGQHNWLIGSPWTFDKHAYPNVMPVIAEFYVDGSKNTDDEYVIAAFVGDECRGVGQWKEGRVIMNVFGNGSEDVVFKAYNKTSEQYYTVAEHVTFVADNSGSWFAPMKLTLGNETTGLEQLNSDLLLKVAGNYITVNAGGKYISRLTVTNMGGVAVLSLSDLGTGATITTKSLADGMYIVTIQAEGKTYYEKILKANK